MEKNSIERLHEFIQSEIKEGNIASMYAMERSCGFRMGYLYNIFKYQSTNQRECGIGSEKLSQIKHAFPKLNMNWLVSGEGSMLIGENPYKQAYEASQKQVEALQKIIDNMTPK